MPRIDTDQSFIHSEDENIPNEISESRLERDLQILDLLRTNALELEDFVYKLKNAVPMVGEIHLVQIAMWDDQLNDMKALLTAVIKGLKHEED